MKLPFGLSAEEIRVLQEFRRLAKETMSLAEITAIKHPAGGGDAPAVALLEKGFLTADDSRQNFTLTEAAKPVLEWNYVPAAERDA